MQWSIRHAYEKVAHYRRAFDEKGVHPADLKSLADLQKFPFTTKKELRDNYPFGMFAVPREQVLRIHASSGTTGKPTVVGYTKRDIDIWADLVARSIRASGGRAGDMVDMASSPAASARITGRRSSAARWCRCRAGRPRSRCS